MGYLKHQRVQHFLRTVRQQCRKCNVRLVLSKGYEVNSEGERCQGYFNQPDHRLGLEGEIRVATGSRRTADWMYTLAHEYAHFLQWMRDDPILDIGERDYWTMEAQTEREALAICKQFRLPIPRRVLLQEHRRYMKKISKYRLA